jgi:hypothetical protein
MTNFLGIIHRLRSLKHDVSETVICLHHQVKTHLLCWAQLTELVSIPVVHPDCLHGEKIIALMMEAVRTSETSVHFNVSTRRYIPEDSKLLTTNTVHTSGHSPNN